MQQGPEAYCQDFAAMEVDLTEEARRLPHPITLLVAAQDRIVPRSFRSALWRRCRKPG
jgi:hypothetical protein